MIDGKSFLLLLTRSARKENVRHDFVFKEKNGIKSFRKKVLFTCKLFSNDRTPLTLQHFTQIL